MADLIDYLTGTALTADRNAGIAKWAAQGGLKNDPDGTLLAQLAPDVYTEKVLPTLFAPKNQALANQQKALDMLSAPQSSALPQMQQGVPLDADNVLSQFSTQAQPQQPQNSGWLTPDQERLLSIADPQKYTQYLIEKNNPENIAKIQKAQTEAAAPLRARQQIELSSTDALGLLDKLKASGDMLTPDSLVGKIGIPIATGTGALGRMLSNTFSPTAESQRAELRGIRSAQIQQYRQAAGIPAGASNSDREQEVIGDMLVDPGISYEANVARLNRFNKLYGTGKEIKSTALSTLAPAPTSAAPSALSQMSTGAGVQGIPDVAPAAIPASGLTPDAARAELARRSALKKAKK